MIFREFENWCEQRVCDGHWGSSEAMICIIVLEYVHNKPFWIRNKCWKEMYETDILHNIVIQTEQKIAKMLGEKG